ncbi:linear amide C-N hydrolase [Mycobacterium sp. Y57]|uniref:linear amide C-N hydrolase n=1 Tax=Mycolicibacterium xanthum TaxID=2796469 RepID=UPI001C85F750|nr:linear amide C-N hydrolase [Mycolicibacterium xanthum]MBX7433679.1 linear amide C-N hydrolase [Mycolicibacterium xanthum]
MCSRVMWQVEGQPVLVGRNMDWTERMGTKLYAIPAGVEREGLVETNPITWTSKYGSVVAAVWDCAVPDGMNAAGLTASMLYLAETRYGDRDPARLGLSVSLWAQYYLDNCATVAEAVEATKSLQVRSFEMIHLGKLADAPMHLSLADATGDSAVIEILDGQPVIHHGPQFTVVTNSPTYDEQLILLKQYEGLGGKKPLPGTAEAEDRFVRGAYYLTQLPQNPASYQEAVAGVLSVIRNMATPIGFVDPVKPNVSPTQWRTICDLTHRRYYFELTNMPNVVWVDLEKLDLQEGAPVQMFDLASDLDAAGEISGRFRPADPIEFQMAGTAVTWKPTPKTA